MNETQGNLRRIQINIFPGGSSGSIRGKTGIFKISSFTNRGMGTPFQKLVRPQQRT